MSYVKTKPGESFESLMKRFKKAVERAGILADIRKHEYYEKPSVKRKRKQAAAKKRAAKKQKQLARILAKKVSGKNFKWNKDKTKKLPLLPPKKFVQKKDFKRSIQGKSNFTNRPTNNKGAKS